MNKSYFKIDTNNYENDFSVQRGKSNINIDFNRVAFIFFIFFIIYLIYVIHLVHLGSRAINKNIFKSSSFNIQMSKMF